MLPSSSPFFLAALLAGSMAGGCATNQEVCVKPVGQLDLTPSEVATSARGTGQVVSWGGQVVETRNRRSDTELEIIGYPLDDCGRPVTQAQPQGRFLVRHSGYLEPQDYRPGRQVTATGRITEMTDEQVGEAHRRFPILGESTIRLWPDQQTSDEFYARPRPFFSIGIGGGSGYVGGGVGVGF